MFEQSVYKLLVELVEADCNLQTFVVSSVAVRSVKVVVIIPGWLGERFCGDEAKAVCWEAAKSTVVDRSEIVELVERDCSRRVVVASFVVVRSVEVVVIVRVWLDERLSGYVANLGFWTLAISTVVERCVVAYKRAKSVLKDTELDDECNEWVVSFC